MQASCSVANEEAKIVLFRGPGATDLQRAPIAAEQPGAQFDLPVIPK